MEAKLDRLTRLVGTDEGFYILALHSFVEYYLRYIKRYGGEGRFGDLTWRFRTELLEGAGEGFVEGLNCLARLGKQHQFTNKVRHAFESMDSEEAAAATHLFVTFCALAGLGEKPQVRELERSLKTWKKRTSVLEQAAVLKQMQRELFELQEKNTELLKQKKAYDETQNKLRELKLKIAGNDLELQRLTERIGEKEEKIDGLRKERRSLRIEQNRLTEKLESFSDLERYLHYLARFSLYTRSRLDYERRIAELSPEQEKAVEAINLKRDFLIKGGAGTGKSLVLLEALRRAAMQMELDLEQGHQVVLVTFTRTLAKYNRYLSEIMKVNIPLHVVRTVDSLFYQKLKYIDAEFGFDYEALDSFLQQEEDTAFMSKEALKSELENHIYANVLAEKDYIDAKLPRRGMPGRLNHEERIQVWKISRKAAAWMDERKSFCKSYSRIKLLEYLENNPNDGGIRDIDYLFLDEVQDLSSADLIVLKMLCRRSVLMAGDTDQSLYQHKAPFAGAGIRISGSTRILKTNFRNTCQLHRLAENFRRRSPIGSWDNTTEPFAFREGPPPELYRSSNEADLLGFLIQKLQVFIKEMDYDPENICILVPRNQELDNVLNFLTKAGLEGVCITNKEFEFNQRAAVRLSTLHSSKGLDFPVVMLYLPYLYRRELYDEEQMEKLMRNLLYVGLTRAMDCLNVFMIPQEDPVLEDLESAFAETISE